MRFLADENVSGLVIAAIRRLGYEMASQAEDRSGAADTAVLAAAEENAQILVTEDTDFGELVIRQGRPVRGVVLLELDRLSNEAEAERVEAVVRDHADQLEGNLVVVEPHRLRVRPLPGFGAP